MWVPAKRLRLLAWVERGTKSRQAEPVRHMHFPWLCVTCLCACCAATNPHQQVAKNWAWRERGGARKWVRQRIQKTCASCEKFFNLSPGSGYTTPSLCTESRRRLLIYHCKVQWHLSYFMSLHVDDGLLNCRQKERERESGRESRQTVALPS